MAVYTARMGLTWQTLQADQFGVLGRTVTYFPAEMRVTNCDRQHVQTWSVSNDVSAQQLTLTPFGVSAPANGLALLVADQPVDVRTNAASDTTFLSAVRLAAFAAVLSAIFVTTGSAATQILLMLAGGSAASVQTTLPVP